MAAREARALLRAESAARRGVDTGARASRDTRPASAGNPDEPHASPLGRNKKKKIKTNTVTSRPQSSTSRSFVPVDNQSEIVIDPKFNRRAHRAQNHTSKVSTARSKSRRDAVRTQSDEDEFDGIESVNEDEDGDGVNDKEDATRPNDQESEADSEDDKEVVGSQTISVHPDIWRIKPVAEIHKGGQRNRKVERINSLLEVNSPNTVILHPSDACERCATAKPFPWPCLVKISRQASGRCSTCDQRPCSFTTDRQGLLGLPWLLEAIQWARSRRDKATGDKVRDEWESIAGTFATLYNQETGKVV